MVEKFSKIQTCPHEDELAVYCPAPHYVAFCNDCYFEQQNKYAGSTTIKKAAIEQISKLESVFQIANEALRSCSDMQNHMLNQESLEEEVIKKCNRQFD